MLGGESQTVPSHLLGGEVSQQFRLLVESVVDYAIFMLDRNGYVVSWNKGAERIKGYTAEEAIGQHFSIFYPEEERAAGKPAKVLEATRIAGRFEEEGWRVRKDGTHFWASVDITPLYGTDGNLVGYAKVTRDLTDRKMADDALHKSEQRFRMLVEGVEDYAIFMLSLDGKVVSWNAGAQRMKGYRSEEVLGRHFSIFYPPEDIVSGKPEMEMERVLAEGRFEEEGWRVRKDGTRFWASVVMSPIRDQDGKVTGFAKVTRDLTERRKARETLLANQRELEQMSRATFRQEELFSVIAHELKGPLSVVYGTAELLRSRFDALPPEERGSLISAVAEEAMRAVRIIDDFRVLGRLEPSELADADLTECIAAAVASFERTAPERRVVIKGPEHVRARIEQTYVDRVVQNLLENAHKYSPRNQPIEVLIGEPQGDHVSVEVLDRGPGVDPTELDMIFESFYRSKRTAGSVSGKGLGLSVCKRLVLSMGGSIEARPRPGGGLCMRVMLLTPEAKFPQAE